MSENKVTLTFSKEKETKNTVKFEEDERQGQPKLVGTLYVQKFMASGKDKVSVTIEF